MGAGLLVHIGYEALRKFHPAVLQILWWGLFPLFVLLIPLGLVARRRAVKLPEARGARLGRSGDLNDRALGLLMVGESPVAGVGVECFEESLPSRLAAHLNRIGGRPVTWQAMGWNGIRLAELLQRLKRQDISGADWVIWLGGVNDTTALTSLATWRRTLREFGRFLSQSGAGAPVFCQVPPMHLFAGIPQPLRFMLGLRAALLDAELAAVCRENNWLLLTMDLALEAEFLAEDGYHPSARGCDKLGLALARGLLANPGPAIPED